MQVPDLVEPFSRNRFRFVHLKYIVIIYVSSNEYSYPDC